MGLEVTPLVLDQAEELIQKAALRIMDVVHVASAMAFQRASGICVPFITGDTRQRNAADQAELDVVWVG